LLSFKQPFIVGWKIYIDHVLDSGGCCPACSAGTFFKSPTSTPN
jgi:hypothetical protein